RSTAGVTDSGPGGPDEAASDPGLDEGKLGIETILVPAPAGSGSATGSGSGGSSDSTASPGSGAAWGNPSEAAASIAPERPAPRRTRTPPAARGTGRETPRTARAGGWC